MAKIILEVTSKHTTVFTELPLAKRIIRKATSARPHGFQFSKKYKMGMWDGWIRLFKHSKFPSGLLDRVCEQLDDAEIDYRIKNKRDRRKVKVSRELSGAKLRKYQYMAARKLLRRSDGIIKLATNAGKTFVFAAMIKALDTRTVIIVHSIDLLYQTRNVIENLTEIPTGVVGDGEYDTANQVTIVSIATLKTKFDMLSKDLADTGMLIVDECHHASSRMSIDLLRKFPPSSTHRRYGASGTPLHYNDLDDMQIVGTLGPIVYEITNQHLIEAGHSARPVMLLHPCTSDGDVKDMDYDSAYRHCIVGNDRRNAKIAELAENLAHYGPILITVNWVEHAHQIAKRLGYTDYEVITGEHSSTKREYILDQMRAGKKMIVVSTIFREGVDVPNIRGMIIACGGSGGSHIRLLQAIGRAIRKKEGIDHVEIHDFVDKGNSYLEEHSAERQLLYEREGFNVINVPI